MKVQLGRICDAVKSTVPQEMWAAIVEKLEELEQHPEALDVGEDAFDDADDEPYDPTEFIDEDDEFYVGLDWRYRGADPETYTGLSGAMSFNRVQEPVTWSKAALQVALAFPCPEAR